MQTQERAFLENYRRYNDFRRTNVVPPKIEHKLEYLAKTILNDMEISQEIRETMDRDEVDALDTLDHYTKLQLFVSISDCLLGKSSPSEAVQAYLRTDKYLSFWELCYISQDQQHLYITTDKKQSISIADIKVLKGLRWKSDKCILTLEINKATILLGFAKQRHAHRLYQLLIQPGKERTMNTPTVMGISHICGSELSFNKTRLKKKYTSVKEMVQERPSQTVASEKTDSVASSEKETSMEHIVEQLTHIQKQLSEQFQLDNLLEDDGYKIEEVLRNGRILVSEEKPDICKLCMTLESNNIHQILNSLSNAISWNTEIQESKVVSRVQPNSYIYYERLKSHGLTRQRDFVFLRQGVCIRDRVHLLDRSVQHASFPPGTRVARGNICKRNITLIPHQNNKKLTLLIVRMNVDYGGYTNTPNDNKHASVRVLKGFAALNQLLDQRPVNVLDLLYNFEKTQNQNKVVKQKKAVKFTEAKTELKTPLKSMENMDFQMSRNSHPHLMIKSEVFLKNNDENNYKEQTTYKDKQHIAQVSMVLEQQKAQQKEIHQQDRLTLNDFMTSYEWEKPKEQYLNLISKKKQHQSIYLKHKYSFGDLPYETKLHKNEAGTDNFVFQNGDWILNQNNEFVFVNEKVINAQKDVIKYVIRKIGTNLISGKSIMNMSLPVQIFDTRGLLQRSAASFGFAPIFLAQAAKTDNLFEQMKLVVTYMLSINLLELRSEKPFNPILGETFQGYLGKTPIYYEQISHHPPISAYYMKNQDYEMYGNLVSFAEMGLNSAVGGNSGIINIKFANTGAHYQCSLPGCEISGLVFGERKVKIINKGFVLNRHNGMMAEISFGRDKKDLYASSNKLNSSDITGGVFIVSEIYVKKYLKVLNKHKFQGLNSKDMIEKLCTIEGAWNGDIKFGGQVYKKLLEPAPYQVEYEKVPLPSNSNYREDIIQRRLDNLAMSQQAKEFGQDRQRLDKKLRGHK